MTGILGTRGNVDAETDMPTGRMPYEDWSCTATSQGNARI